MSKNSKYTKFIKILKYHLPTLIIGILIGSVSVVAAESIINSDSVEYDNTISKSKYSNVQSVLDDLYSLTKYNGTGLELSMILPNGMSTSSYAEMYRYQGTNDQVYNYICFGTTDKGRRFTKERSGRFEPG